MANRYADKVPGAEDDDLYQTGFLAMLRAVDRYEEPHSFLSGLVFALKREYAELGGYLTSKRDPLIAAVSLDAPLSDEDDSTLQDLLADPLSLPCGARTFLTRGLSALRPRLSGPVAQIL